MKKSFGKIVCIIALSASTGAWAATWTGETNFTQDTSFDDVYTNTTALTSSAGTSESPIVFSATERTDGFTNGLTQTGGNFTLNNGANLKISSGQYRFANDIILNNGANLTIDGGYVSTAYWMLMRSATVTVNGGTFSTAVRNGEQTYDTGNGMLNMGDQANSQPVFVQNGGRVHVVGSNNNGDRNIALSVGNHASADASYTLNGGELDSDGFICVPRNGKGVFTQNGGTIDSLRSFQIAVYEGTEGTINFNGGTATTPDWIEVAYGKKSKGTMNVGGGAVSLTGKSSPIVKVGVGETSLGVVNVTAGSISMDGNAYPIIGAGTSATGIVTVTGGTIANAVNDYVFGDAKGAVGEMTIGGTGVVSSGSSSTAKWIKLANNSSSAMSRITLNEGGTLAAWHIQPATTAPSEIIFNGGTLKALGVDSSNNYYLLGKSGGTAGTSTEGHTISVSENGGTIDNNGKYIHINQAISGNDGTLTLTGAGITELCVVPSCGVNVAQGVALVKAGAEFASPVIIGAKGAIAVDITDAIDTSTIAVDDTIKLFKTTSLTFENAADTLDDTVFLTGTVVGYTLLLDSEDGWVKATVTDVTNIASTRKVTTFVAEDNYIDQNASWSNGQPTDKSYDTIIFTADATMRVWSAGWGDGNNRACERMVLRGTTVLAQHPDTWNPCLDKRYIVGNGTLQLRRLGLECRNAPGTGGPIVGTNITVEIVQTSANSDTWVVAPTIYGTLKVTTGYTIFNNDTKLYGAAIFANASRDSYVTASTATGTYIDCPFTVEDGCNFNFNNAAITCGENAQLILKGTGKISGASQCVFPTIVLGEGSVHLFSELNKNGGNLELDGGTLKMAYNQLDGTGTNLVLKAGQLTLDMSGVSGASVGTAVTNANVTLAQGATVDDVTIVAIGSAFKWNPSFDARGNLVVTAASADGPNRWVGGASGNWKDAVNWQYGVPATGATAQIDNDATIYFNANKTVSNIVVNANVQFRTTDYMKVHPTIYIREVNGTGTIGLYHCGLEANGLPGTIASTVTLRFDSTESSGSDSWLKGSSASNPLLVYAPLTGAGFARIYDNTRFYGDNEGFTGKMRKDDVDARFMTPESGIPNAEMFDCHGTLWIWFDEGTITFPKTTMTSTGNRGINMPAGAATSEKGVTVVVGNNNGAVTMTGPADKVYHAYTQNDTWWTQGCDNFTFKKIGTGTLSTYIENKCNLVLDGGTTSFAADCLGTSITVKSNACLTATDTLRKIGGTNGSLTMEADSGIWLGDLDNATNLVADCNVDVTGVKIVADEEVQAELLTKTDPKVIPVLILTDGHAITGTPAAATIPTSDPKASWVAQVKDNALNLVRKSIKKGLRIIFR